MQGSLSMMVYFLIFPISLNAFIVHSISLPFVIRGQQGGIESVLNAFSAWEFSRKSGSSGPLVLAIVGPTGVGKSETGGDSYSSLNI